MKALTKKSAVFYLAAMFVAGALLGGLGGYAMGMRKAFRPPARGEINARMAEFARAKLKLTDDQMKQVQPIINDTCSEFETSFKGMGDRFNDIARRASQRISPLLTPEQRKILDDLDRQREERFRDAFKQRSTD
jgi:hypothetical protein